MHTDHKRFRNKYLFASDTGASNVTVLLAGGDNSLTPCSFILLLYFRGFPIVIAKSCCPSRNQIVSGYPKRAEDSSFL